MLQTGFKGLFSCFVVNRLHRGNDESRGNYEKITEVFCVKMNVAYSNRLYHIAWMCSKLHCLNLYKYTV
jgi:hypothetical protein